MSRLIDADAIPYVDLNSDMPQSKVRVWVAFKDKIDSMPTIEARKKGRWEQVSVSYMSEMDEESREVIAIASMFCPQCKRYHNEVYIYGNPTYGVNFCSNCGADMRGDE